MTVSTTTSGTETINEEVIDMLLAEYQFEEETFLPFARFGSLVGQTANKYEFPRRAKDNVTNTIANESTSLTPQEWKPTTTAVTVARAGIAREPSESLIEDTLLGDAGLMNELMMDARRLLAEARDSDLADEFSNANNSVSNAGSALTIANVISALGTQRVNNARGPQVIGLGHQQLEDLQAAQQSTTGTPWAQFFQPNADGSSNFGGFFMNAPVFSSDNVPTANTAKNRVGAVWSRGDVAPEYCAFAYVLKREISMKQDEDVLKDTRQMAFITRYGVGTPAANFATSITSQNSS